MEYQTPRNPIQQIEREILKRTKLAGTTTGLGTGQDGGTIDPVTGNWVSRWTLGVSQLGIDTYL